MKHTELVEVLEVMEDLSNEVLKVVKHMKSSSKYPAVALDKAKDHCQLLTDLIKAAKEMIQQAELTDNVEEIDEKMSKFIEGFDANAKEMDEEDAKFIDENYTELLAKEREKGI